MYRLTLSFIENLRGEWNIESAGTGEFETFEDALRECNKRNTERREQERKPREETPDDKQQ